MGFRASFKTRKKKEGKKEKSRWKKRRKEKRIRNIVVAERKKKVDVKLIVPIWILIFCSQISIRSMGAWNGITFSALTYPSCYSWLFFSNFLNLRLILLFLLFISPSPSPTLFVFTPFFVYLSEYVPFFRDSWLGHLVNVFAFRSSHFPLFSFVCSIVFFLSISVFILLLSYRLWG